MSSWQLGAAANLTISVAYLSIAVIVLSGLARSRQLRRNPLASATGLIFFSCGIGHGLHGLHLVMPMDGAAMTGMSGMRAGWTWEMSVWDAVTACVAVTYLALRRRYGQLLNTPEMFRDEVDRAKSRELADVLHALPEAVVVLARDGGIEHMNPAAQRLAFLERVDIRALVAATAHHAMPVDDFELDTDDGARGRRRVRLSARALDADQSAPHRVVVALTDITERHEARRELLLSEQRHRTVVESLHEGVVLQLPDGRITTANARAEELLGLTGDQLVGRTSIDPRWRAVHADGSPWPGEDHPVPRALREGVHVGPETMGIHTPDGQLRWLEVNATPLRDGDGQVCAAVASFVDVTARRDAEAALLSSERQVRTTLEALTEGVALYDEQLVIRAMNPAGARVFGLPAEEMIGRPLMSSGFDIIDEDGRSLAFEQWPVVKASEHGEAVKDVVIGLRAHVGAEVLWLETSVTPVGSGHRPLAVVASFADITDRVRGARDLAAAEQRVRATFDGAPVGVHVEGLDGTLQEVNPALAELLGFHPEELVGRREVDFTHPEDRSAQAEGHAALLEGDLGVLRLEKRMLHAAGHAIWVQLDLTLLRDADERPTGFIGHVQDVSERRRHDEQLRHMADHDALTGLLNRRGFTGELERHVAQARRYGGAGALLMLDLDNFKLVNDTLGHKAGDELIVAVADILRTRLRDSDVVARLGGDEFAVLLPRGGVEEAAAAAESILTCLRDRQSELPGSGRRRVSASIGVAAAGEGRLTADELLVDADLAMYDAKEAGRDQVATYESGPFAQPRLKSRLTWMDRISAALDNDAFTLMAQPITSLSPAGDEVAMHELLLRMHGEGGDLVPPATFLYIAERFDLIQRIDRWVIDAACSLLGRQASGGPSLAINISAKSLADASTLAGHLEQALERHQAPAEKLVVEITETAAVSQMHDARAFAGGLQRLGCRLAIDDFGAGFGSFYYLKHLPFDYLKIDGEFVRNARTSRPDALIIRALRDMAHGLDRHVIAEHVTDQESLAYLREEGVDFAQGFHLGRPVPAEQQLVFA